MIFRQWREVLDGTKTQTRRVVKDGEVLRYWWRGLLLPTIVDTVAYRAKWQVGRTYAVQPARTKRSVGRIRLTAIRRERLQEITHQDALAEGCPSVDAYWMLWNAINKRKGTRWEDNPEVWVLTFQVVGEERDRP